MTLDVGQVVTQVNTAIEELRFKLPGPDVDFNAMSEEELRNQLSRFGAYQGYISVQLARLESAKVAVDRILSGRINSRMVIVEKGSDKRRLKDSIIAEIVGSDPELQQLNQSSIEIDAEFTALSRIHDAMEAYWKTVSRILSSRGQEIGKL